MCSSKNSESQAKWKVCQGKGGDDSFIFAFILIAVPEQALAPRREVHILALLRSLEPQEREERKNENEMDVEDGPGRKSNATPLASKSKQNL
jgi:hypothetical protein